MTHSISGLTFSLGSILTVDRVSPALHEGNYTCAPSSVTSASVRVNIIDEGKMPPAPVYGDAHSSTSKATKTINKHLKDLSMLVTAAIIIIF